MDELKEMLESVRGSYFDFVVAVLLYARKKQSRHEAVKGFMKQHPEADTSDILEFISDQPDFWEDAGIFGYIKSCIDENGNLPDDFSLPAVEGDDLIGWMDGALDGVSIYHMPYGDPSEKTMERLASAVNAAAAGHYKEADRILTKIGEEDRAVDVIEEMQHYIIDRADSLAADNIRRYGMQSILTSRDREIVKIGLGLMELFPEPEEDRKDIFRTIGLSDEFTLFVIYNMRRWKDGNEEIFRLAQKVHGWGRIHAVECLEADTDGIRDWLLRGGYRNTVMDEYTALTCFTKSGAKERLAGSISDEDYRHIGNMLSAMTVEGPAEGITGLEDPEQTLSLYIGQSEGRNLSFQDYKNIFAIRQYAAGNDLGEVRTCADKVLHDTRCAAEVTEALKGLKAGKAVRLAEYLEIPYRKSVFHNIQENFDEQYRNIRWLMDDPEYADKVLDLYRKEIPPETIEDDPRDEIGLEWKCSKYLKLDMLLQELGRSPVKGADIISRTLCSPAVRNRSMSGRILKAWVSSCGKPLAVLSPELHRRAVYAYNKEVRKDLKETLKELIDGKTVFSDGRGAGERSGAEDTGREGSGNG